jgi:RNA recognition motif-containing protein
MNIYISNLSWGLQDEDLQSIFSSYGEISSAKVIVDRFTGKSRGFGFVEMANDGEANNAIEGLNQTEHDGKVINVSEARPREDRSSGGGSNNRFGGGGGGNKGGYGNDRFNR